MTARSLGGFARPWLAAIALVAIGAVGALATDPRPDRPIVRRGEYRVLEGDFHAHTTLSDGMLSPVTIVRQAERRGLDVLGVTEHNTTLAAKIARTYSGVSNGPIIVVGEEVTAGKYHLIALGLTDTVSASQPLPKVIEDIHAQRGVAIAAHPVKRFWPALVPVRPELDGTEVMHPLAFQQRGGGWRWEEMVEYEKNAEKPLAPIGSSDFHFASVLGICRTLIFVPANAPANEAAVVDAIRERRTVVIDRDGDFHGAPALVDLLKKEPYTPRTSDYAYRGEGTADRVLRTIGWLGVLGVVLLRARRSKQDDSAKAST
jgi:hypothetical protein